MCWAEYVTRFATREALEEGDGADESSSEEEVRFSMLKLRSSFQH